MLVPKTAKASDSTIIVKTDTRFIGISPQVDATLSVEGCSNARKLSVRQG
jgi:hypothetical protein